MKAKELHKMTDKELLTMLTEAQDKKRLLEGQRGFSNSQAPFNQAGQLQNTKRLIARIYTILHLRKQRLAS